MNTPGSHPLNKILLVEPENAKGSFWDFSHILKLIGKKAFTPPLGLITIAAMLPQDKYELRFLDMNIKPLTQKDLEWADMVFISGMTISSLSMDEVLDKAKKAGCLTVVGGAHATIAYTHIAGPNCLVIGEAEAIWKEFLVDLAAGTLKRAYASPCSEQERQAIMDAFGNDAFIAPPGTHPDIADIPVARFDLLDMSVYKYMLVQSTRGCPFKCDFCDIWVRFGKMRCRNVEKVIAELDELYALGWRGNIILANDNAFGHRAYAKELLLAISRWQIEHGCPFSFHTESSINIAEDTEMLELCVASGVAGLFLGIESPNADSLKEINKGVNLVGNMEQRVATIQGYGMSTAAGLIVGLDADPDNIAELIADSVQQMGIVEAMPSLLMALPFTALTTRLEEQGRLFQVTHDRYNNAHIFLNNFQTQRPIAEVQASFNSLLNSLYPSDMKNYFDRCFTFLSRRGKARKNTVAKIRKKYCPGVKRLTPPNPKKTRRIPLRVLLMLASIIMFRPYGRNALRFIMDIRKTNPEHTKRAISRVILAQHFWAMARAYNAASNLWQDMAQKLGWLYARLGNAMPERTTLLLGNPLPCHSVAAAPVDAAQTQALGQSVLNEIAAKLQRLPPAAQIMLENEFQCFRNDVDACILQAKERNASPNA